MEKYISYKLTSAYFTAFKNEFTNQPAPSKVKFIKKLLHVFEKFNEQHIVWIRQSPLTKIYYQDSKQYDILNDQCTEFLLQYIEYGNDEYKDGIYLPDLYVSIGLCYELGAFNFQIDYAKAFLFYKRSSSFEYGLGAFKVGVCYEKGINRYMSYEKASTYYRIAAKLGCIEALHIYGCILLYGNLNLHQDIKTGSFYLKMAVKKANKDYPYPHYDLGQFFEKYNEEHMDQNYAYEIYLRGANMGCQNCLYKLGKIYEFGQIEKTKNMALAISWYRKAADLEQPEAQIAMSAFYYTGLGGVISRNLSEAYQWCERSAINGHRIAAYTMGEFIENSVGTENNPAHSLWWYTISFKLGYKKAKLKITKFQSKLKYHIR